MSMGIISLIWIKVSEYRGVGVPLTAQGKSSERVPCSDTLAYMADGLRLLDGGHENAGVGYDA